MILPNVRSAVHSTAVVKSTSLVLPYDRLTRPVTLLRVVDHISNQTWLLSFITLQKFLIFWLKVMVKVFLVKIRYIQ